MSSTFVVKNSEAPSRIDFDATRRQRHDHVDPAHDLAHRAGVGAAVDEPSRRWLAARRGSRGCRRTSASSETTSWSVCSSRCRTRFDEMNSAPPVTRTRLPGRASAT